MADQPQSFSADDIYGAQAAPSKAAPADNTFSADEIYGATAAPTPAAAPASRATKFGRDYPGDGPGFPVSKYQLPNGIVTDTRSDAAVWLEPSKGFKGKPGWYYMQPATQKTPTGQQQFYINPAPDTDQGNVVSAQTDPEFAQRYASALKDAEQQRREFIREHSVYDEATKSYKYQGPELSNEPITLATDPSLGRPLLQRKAIGIEKAVVGGVGQIAQGLAGAAQMSVEASNPLLLAGRYLPESTLNKYPSLKAAVQKTQQTYDPITGAIQQAGENAARRTQMYGTPSPSETSAASNVAGMVPLVAGAASLPEAAAPAALGSVFAGNARNEIDAMRQQINPATGQPFDIGPGKELGYEALNFGLGALPIGPAEGAFAKRFLPESISGAMKNGIIGPSLKEAATFSALSAAPTAYRKYVLGDQSADVLGSAEESAKTGLIFGGLMAGGKYYFANRPKPTNIFGRTAMTPDEAQQRITTLASGSSGMTPLEYSEATGVPVNDARRILSGLANDPNHPVKDLGNGNFGVPAEAPAGLNADHERQISQIRDNAIKHLTDMGMSREDAAVYADEHAAMVMDIAHRTGANPVDLERDMLLSIEPGRKPEAPAVGPEAEVGPGRAQGKSIDQQGPSRAALNMTPAERDAEIASLGRRRWTTGLSEQENDRLDDLLMARSEVFKRGGKTGTKPHKVTIFWNPHEDLSIGKYNAETEAGAHPTDGEQRSATEAPKTVEPTERRGQSARAKEIRDLTGKRKAGTITPDEERRLNDVLLEDRVQGKIQNAELPGALNTIAYHEAHEAGKLKPAQVFVDLDNFKDVNDTLGHAAGDEAIKEFSKSLVDHFGEGNVFHRGGDEFIVQADTPEQAREQIEKVRQRMNSLELEGEGNKRTGIDFSEGIAEPGDEKTSKGVPVPEAEAERQHMLEKQRKLEAGIRHIRKPEVPTAEAATEAQPEAAKPSVVMNIKVGKNTLSVPLEDPNHIARYQRAQRQFETMRAAIKANPDLSKQQRAQAYKAQGDALKYEKLLIKDEIDQKKAAARADKVPGPDLLEAVADKAIGKDAPVTAQQAAAMRLQQRNDLRGLAMRAIKAGASTAEEFRQIVNEQNGNSQLKNLTDSQLNAIFREAKGKVTAESVTPRIRSGEEKGNYIRRVANWIREQGHTSYNGNYIVPEIPENDLTERDAPQAPMRDLTPSERGYRGNKKGLGDLLDASVLASPNQLLSGLWHRTLGPVFRGGFSPVVEAISANFLRDSLIRSFYDWGRDVLGGVPSGAKIVGDLNGELASRYLSNIADMWPLINEAKEAHAAGEQAFNEFLSTPRGERYTKLNGENLEIVKKINKNNQRAALESSGSRIIQYAESTPGGEAEANLRKLMQDSEVRKAEAIRSFYAKVKTRLDQLGIPTLDPNEMYVTHTGFEQFARDGWNKLQDTTRNTNRTPDQIQEVLAFAHRQAGAPNFFPDAGMSLNAYIEPAARKIAYQGWLNKWMPLVENNFVTDNNPAGAPRVASYLRELTKDVLYRNDTTLDRMAGVVANIEHGRTLTGSLATPFKHLFKLLGVMAENGVRPTVKAGIGSAFLLVPQSALENAAMAKFAKNLGVNVDRIKDIKLITESFRRSREINRQLDAVPGLSGFTNNLFKRAASSALRAGSAPLTLVEAWTRGVNVLATMYRSDKASMRPDEAFRQAIHNTAALDFYGSWDNPGFQRSGLGRMLTLYQQTPFKMAEQYLNWAIKPDSVDAFGTKNGVKFFRYAVALGVLAALGDATDTPIVGHNVLHPPFLQQNYMTGKWGLAEPQAIEDIHNIFSEQKSGLANANTWANILSDTGTVQGLKYSKAISGDIPKMYDKSRARYIFGLPKTSIMEQEQAAQAAKAEKSAKTRAQKFLGRIVPSSATQEQ